MSSTTKKIYVDLPSSGESLRNSRAVATVASDYTELAPQQTKKIITTKKIWECIQPADLEPENQKRIMNEARDFLHDYCDAGAPPPPHYRVLRCHIQQKLYSYKMQDLAKDKYDEGRFIDIEGVFDLLHDSDMLCYYCKKTVMLLYEYIREPMQWSLDRIDNSQGHNRGNLYLSCLSCNLRRRCMYPERYVFTKACMEVKKLDV